MTLGLNDDRTRIELLSRVIAHQNLVVQTLRRFGRITRQRMLQRLFHEGCGMISFDLDRALTGLRGKVITERENGKTYYSLRRGL